MNQKKGQPVTWFDCAELPCAAHKERATSESRTPLRGVYTPCGILRLVAYPLFVPLLGGVNGTKIYSPINYLSIPS
jgi:hypothetical protein